MIVALIGAARFLPAEIKNSHAHGEAVGDLVENDALQAVGDFAVDLDAAVDRAWMHDQAIGFQKLRPLFRQAEKPDVFADPGKYSLR